MPSHLIRTYLLSHLLAILHHQDFRDLVLPKPDPQCSSRASSLSSGMILVSESFMVCIAKLLQLLFMEDTFNSRRLYQEIFERLGEGAIRMSQKFLLVKSRDYPSSSLGYQDVKQRCMYENDLLF
jgi:hypothetical protein